MSEDYWAGWIETAPSEQLRRIQDAKVTRLSKWVYRRSQFWSERFRAAEITPSMIHGVDDLQGVPFGRKDAYRRAQTENPPYGGLLCREAEDIHREGGFVWETSGTTGEPLKFLCSQREFRRVDVEATCRILWTAGIRPGDSVGMFWPLTLWAVGHGIVEAAQSIGLTVYPLGPSYSSELRASKVVEYEPDVVMTTPTYALRLAEAVSELGHDPSAVGVERAILSGEPLPEETRDAVADRWGLGDDVYNYYGLSEAFNCRSIECEHHDGMHVQEDLYLCQVVEPDGTEPVAAGETGELVVTALEQRDIATGFHYRTGDLARYTDEPCECGRTTRRIKILSRKDDMRTVRGVNVYPQAVESVVRDEPDVADEFRLVLEKRGDLDALTVLVEPCPDVEESEYDPLRTRIEGRLERTFGGLSVPVEFTDPGELERFSFKADRWIDRRHGT